MNTITKGPAKLLPRTQRLRQLIAEHGAGCRVHIVRGSVPCFFDKPGAFIVTDDGLHSRWVKLDQLEQPEPFYVAGSYGSVIASPVTGEVLACEDELDAEGNDAPGEGEYSDITRFDIAEWARTYPDEDIAGQSVDILDIGYWTNDGAYVPPEEDWRRTIKRELLNQGDSE